MIHFQIFLLKSSLFNSICAKERCDNTYLKISFENQELLIIFRKTTKCGVDVSGWMEKRDEFYYFLMCDTIFKILLSVQPALIFNFSAALKSLFSKSTK